MQTELIHEVLSVDAHTHTHSSSSSRLHVTAKGNASSGGHLNPRLERRIYIVFPEDGVQEYDFQIDIPEGTGTTDMKEHTVEDKWDGFPKELKGVRVYSRTNKLETQI